MKQIKYTVYSAFNLTFRFLIAENVMVEEILYLKSIFQMIEIFYDRQFRIKEFFGGLFIYLFI